MNVHPFFLTHRQVFALGNRKKSAPKRMMANEIFATTTSFLSDRC